MGCSSSTPNNLESFDSVVLEGTAITPLAETPPDTSSAAEHDIPVVASGTKGGISLHNPDYVFELSVDSRWVGYGGGKETDDTLFHPSNMQVDILGVPGTEVHLELHQPVPVRSRVPATFVIFGVCNKYPLESADGVEFIARPQFSQNPVKTTVVLPETGQIVVICTRSFNKVGDFTLKVMSTYDVTVSHTPIIPRISPEDATKQVSIVGQWSSDTSGGLFGSLSFSSNPYARIIVSEDLCPFFINGQLEKGTVTPYSLYLLDCPAEEADESNIQWKWMKPTVKRRFVDQVLLPIGTHYFVMGFPDSDDCNTLSVSFCSEHDGAISAEML